MLVGRDRLGWRALCAALTLAILACGAPQPPPRLYVVKSGPYPLYEHNGDWLATRLSGLPLAEIEERIIREARMTQAQNRATSTTDGPWLHSGCIFDVQRTAPDAQDGSYVWAYGKVVRCDEPVVTGLPERRDGADVWYFGTSSDADRPLSASGGLITRSPTAEIDHDHAPPVHQLSPCRSAVCDAPAN